MLKHCIGLLEPAAGQVEILGVPLHGLEGEARTAILRRIGVLFQYGALLGSITVGQNVALPIHEHTGSPSRSSRRWCG